MLPRRKLACTVRTPACLTYYCLDRILTVCFFRTLLCRRPPVVARLPWPACDYFAYAAATTTFLRLLISKLVMMALHGFLICSLRKPVTAPKTALFAYLRAALTRKWPGTFCASLCSNLSIIVQKNGRLQSMKIFSFS